MRFQLYNSIKAHLKGAYKKEGQISDRTRSNGFNLKEGRFILDFRKKFFTQREVKHSKILPRDVVDAPSLEVSWLLYWQISYFYNMAWK